LTLDSLEQDYKKLLKKYSSVVPDEVSEIYWMLQELRVSFFAQTLGTKYPVSEKRVKNAMEEARA
jgi:ATP-dependent helicase HrpA